MLEIAFICVLSYNIFYTTPDLSINWVFLIIPVAFLLISFAVMHLGINNATDCCWTLLLVISHNLSLVDAIYSDHSLPAV